MYGRSRTSAVDLAQNWAELIAIIAALAAVALALLVFQGRLSHTGGQCHLFFYFAFIAEHSDCREEYRGAAG